MLKSPTAATSRLAIAAALWLAMPLAAISSSPQVVSNPDVKAAVERGQAMFEQYCSACHGKGGTGDGPAAASMTTKPTNLTVMKKRHGAFLAAQVESAIRGTSPVVAHGVPGMMVWAAMFRADARGNRTLVDTRIRELVAFVETIQEK